MLDKFRPSHLLRGEKSEQLACNYLIKARFIRGRKKFSE